MPLNFKALSSMPESSGLPEKTAITAFIFGTALVIAPIPQLIVSQNSIFQFLATAFISPVCGIIAMCLILLKDGGKDFLNVSKLSFKEIRYISYATAVIIFSGGIVNFLWKCCLDLLTVPYSKEQGLLTLAKSCSSTEFAMLSIFVILVVPVAEELLFRRILFAGLQPLGKTTAWLGTAGVFAAVHLFLAGLPGLFVIGLGFQWLYCRHKNLAASIFSHGLLNACTVLAVLFSRGV